MSCSAKTHSMRLAQGTSTKVSAYCASICYKKEGKIAINQKSTTRLTEEIKLNDYCGELSISIYRHHFLCIANSKGQIVS
jgi:hypothetical protein